MNEENRVGLKVNVTEPLLAYNGTPMVDAADKKTKITLRMLLRQVLNSPIEGEPWTPDSMMLCAKLSLRAATEDTPEFDETERTMLKERAAKVYQYQPDAPQLYMHIMEALSDPPAEPESEHTE